jgi:hypothetical protein
MFSVFGVLVFFGGFVLISFLAISSYTSGCDSQTQHDFGYDCVKAKNMKPVNITMLAIGILSVLLGFVYHIVLNLKINPKGRLVYKQTAHSEMG